MCWPPILTGIVFDVDITANSIDKPVVAGRGLFVRYLGRAGMVFGNQGSQSQVSLFRRK